ncbi:MAG: hypothetical protein K0Q79_2412 [Flavipsychrobacter sp.]|jgi:hypothetical protein|nr:hypothetical protein [Flavipsychrobacter sp.]
MPDFSLQNENMRLRSVARLIPWAIVLLLAGAVIFYKERMLFIDAPHILFRIVNDGRLHIEEYRVGSFITQLFPLLASKLHLPFKLLVVLYSASFYLFYLGVTLLVVYKFRNYALGILFGLYLTLLVSDTYYWPNNEVHQGIGWLMLAFAICLNAGYNNRAVFLLSIGLFAMAIWTHPLVMFVAIFLWLFVVLSGYLCPFSWTQTIVLTVALLVLSVLKYYQSSHHGYDNTKIETVHGFELQNLKNVLTSPMLHSFLKNCLSNYWLFTLLFAAGLSALVWSKRYILFLFTLLYAIGYLLLVCIVFGDATPNRFHIESEYMPLTFICCAPFVYFLLPRLNTKAAFVLFALIFGVQAGYIYGASKPFTARVAILDAANNKMKEKSLTKVIIPEPVAGIDSALITNWGAPVESIILSKLKGETPQRTFIFGDAAFIASMADVGRDTLIGCWQLWRAKEINSFYFQPDMNAKYVVMSYSDLMK